MFNDYYGLTKFVLNGYKTVTRRVLPLTPEDEFEINIADKRWEWRIAEMKMLHKYATYDIGDIVAVCERYKDINTDGKFDMMRNSAGWNNKMFVKAEYMPNHIQITDRYIQRLQDISDKDCLREGVLGSDLFIKPYGMIIGYDNYSFDFNSPREAFAYLIDHISGKGTWDSNPYVVVYEFRRIYI